MARTISYNLREAMFAQETDEVPVLLITITHPDLAGPLRLSTDPTQRLTDVPLVYGTISRTNPFYFLPISAVLPDDKDESPPQARLQIDNIDRSMIRLLRSTDEPAQVMMEMVLSGSPSLVEMTFPVLDLVAVDYDAKSITLTLEINALMNEPYPAGRFDPQGFPGIF